MYSEKYIIEMVDSYNCLRLDNKHVFQVEIYEDKDKQKFFEFDIKKIPFKSLRVGQLAKFISLQERFQVSKLWKVDVDKSKLNPGSTDDDIKELGGVSIEFEYNFKEYFQKDYKPTENKIHIVAVIATTTTVTSIEDAMKKILEGIHASVAVGADEPKMTLKQRDFEKAIEVIDKNFNSSLVKQKAEKKATPTAKINYQILLCGGAPGIGKTRYGVELFNSILDKEWKGQKPYMLNVIFNLTNGYAIDEHEIQEDIKIASQIILGLRLAFHYFVYEKYKMNFTVFRTKANEYKEMFKLDNVLMQIVKHENLHSGQHLFILLQIDEFQRIFKDRNEEEKGKKLFKQLLYTLGHHMTGEIPEVFVQTLLLGTAPQDAIRAIEPTMYSIELLNLPLLSLESCLEIMREFATNHDVPDCVWVPQIWIHQLLLDTGGLPRALEDLFKEFFGDNFTNVKEFFDKLVNKKLIPLTIYTIISNKIDVAYTIKSNVKDYKLLAYELIYRNIMQIKSDISDELRDGDHYIKLEHLERDKHLILRKLEVRDKFLVDMPYFFMYLYADVLEVFTENLNKAFLPDLNWSWEDWEIFIADFIASQITMIDVLNKNKLFKLKDFFCSVQGNDNTLNLLINFEPVKIYKLKHRFPCLDLSMKEGETAMLKPGYMMINGYSAPFADVFFLVDNPEPIFIAIQCRKRKKSLDLNTIEDEHEKNLNISEKMKEKAEKFREDAEVKGGEMEKLLKKAEQYTQLADFLSKYRIITIFITTQRFIEELEYLPDDCILIYQENFDIFFGPVFSSRTKLVMTSDSNPNLSTASELTSRFKAIKEDIGEKIESIRKRKTFRSHDEFCEEFPDLKYNDEIRNNFIYYPYPPHIEPFEHSNKRTRV